MRSYYLQYCLPLFLVSGYNSQLLYLICAVYSIYFRMDLEQGSVWSLPLSPPLEVTRPLIEVPLPRSIEVPLTPSSMTALEVGSSPLIEVPPHNKNVSSTRIKPHKVNKVNVLIRW